MAPVGRRIALNLLFLVLIFAAARPAYAIPAFARKYGLPCSACHQAWPMLNNFGQTFKDNGFQLGNGRDAPEYQEPAYWPITFRVTPQWHRESNNRRAVDKVPGNAGSGLVESNVTESGFDLSSIDIVTAGTLYNNISFLVQPYINSNSVFIAQGWVRFDNLGGSRWFNLKMGKFVLDEPLSQERSLFLSGAGGSYYNYFFTPPGDNNVFGGIGGTPLGAELLGHSGNDYTRYSFSVFSSNSGQTGLPTNQTYDIYANVSQAFELPRLGLQKFGVYGYFGQTPTFYQTAGGRPLPGTGTGNRSFSRTGAYGMWYLGKFDVSTFFMHGQDGVFTGNSVPGNDPSKLPVGAAGPTWNGGFVQVNYSYNPRLIVMSKYELIRMSREANPTLRGNAGNLDNWAVGYRWYPFMSPRAGLAWVQEYSRILNAGTAPISHKDDIGSSLLMGFDFDF